MRWLGVLLIGCGGLADDSRHPLPHAQTDAGAFAASEEEPPERARRDTPEDTPPAQRRVGEAPATGVGAACGAALDSSRSVTGGGITLGSDAACGAGAVCLISVAPSAPVCHPGVADPALCPVPTEDVVPVPPSATRALEVDHICSCRCDGPGPSESLCRCPSGSVCAPLVTSSGVGGRALDQVGSYCVL